MNNAVRMACQPDIAEIELTRILPMRRLDEGIRTTSKYRCIEASVRELGLIEPLVVFPQPKAKEQFILLDGHVRLMILQSLAAASAECLIATDDEGFTYNHKVNRLSPIQEHFMILRAIKNGVPESRIARSLNVDVQSIRNKRDLLDGICPEAVQLLREKRMSANALRELRKVKPMRQIEISELVCAANSFGAGYLKCLVAASPAESLVEGERGKDIRGLSADDVARMEHEVESLGRHFKLIEATYGNDVLNLVVVVGYLRKLLENPRVARHLASRHPEIHSEFQKLVESRSLGDCVPPKLAAE